VKDPGTTRFAATTLIKFDVNETFKFEENTLLTVRAFETKTLRNDAVLDPIMDPNMFPVATRFVAETALAEYTLRNVAVFDPAIDP
jgi:hypothetical protein